MKINSSELPKLVKMLESSVIKGVLFFGPNIGEAEYIASLIQYKLAIKDITKIDYKELQSKPEQILCASSLFFSGANIVQVREVEGVFDKALERTLSAIEHIAVIPFLFASDLAPSAGVRKFFENNEHYAAIGCYYADEAQVSKLIIGYLLKHGKTIEQDALKFLLYHLKGDRLIILSELSKLITYTQQNNSISLEDVEAVITTDNTSSADAMCIYFALGEVQKFEQEATKLLKESIAAIWIIRALIRYYSNLYIVLLKQEYGISREIGIKEIKPAIFFKYLPAFRKALEHNNHAYSIKILHGLCELEKKIKRGILDEQKSLEHLILLRSHS